MKVREESKKAGLKLNIQKMKIRASGPITSWQTDGETMETVTDLIFLGSKITADGDCSHEIKSHLLLGRKAMTNLDSILKSRDITKKGLYHQSCGFSSGHVWMWELDHRKSWALKNWCFWTVVLEKALESPLDSMAIQPVHSKGGQFWIFIGRTDAKDETPILLAPDAKSWLIEKDPDAGKDWRQEEKETAEDEMVGWHHRLDGCEFEHSAGVGDGQGGLGWCSPSGCKESDTTVWLNKEPASVFPVGLYSSSWDVCIIIGVSVLVCYINIEYYAFVHLKDELDWGRLNYIQIKRIREVSCIFFEHK